MTYCADYCVHVVAEEVSNTITVVSVSDTQHTSTVRPSVSKMTHETSMLYIPHHQFVNIIYYNIIFLHVIVDLPSDMYICSSSKSSFLKGTLIL